MHKAVGSTATGTATENAAKRNAGSRATAGAGTVSIMPGAKLAAGLTETMSVDERAQTSPVIMREGDRGVLGYKGGAVRHGVKGGRSAATGEVHQRAGVTSTVVVPAALGAGKGADESMLITSGVWG